MEKNAKQTLPVLPKGQGSFSYYKDDLIMFRKVIIDSDGKKVRKSVYAKTVTDCFKKMNNLEAAAINKDRTSFSINCNADNLYNQMLYWLDNYKKPMLKPQSYRRLLGLINNQIGKSLLYNRYPFDISTDEFQILLNQLNEQHLSHSTIKKVYNCLNDFYRYYSIKTNSSNPMILVNMPSLDNIKKETKTIEWMEQDDIDKFINEAAATYSNGKPVYNGSLMLAANIYLGLRIGELLALSWKDIDLENRVIHVSKTLIQALNPDYDYTNEELMKAKGIKKNIFVVQDSNKTHSKRLVPINTAAYELIIKHRDTCIYIGQNDYVISTRTGKTTTIKNISNTLKDIEKNAGTKIQGGSTHVLRHTCASLYFKKKIPVEIIARILGHSIDVCQSTYIHFSEQEIIKDINF